MGIFKKSGSLLLRFITKKKTRRDCLQVAKYVAVKPYSLLYEKYDSVIANALYGKTREIISNDMIDRTTLEKYLFKHNMECKMADIVISLTIARSNSISQLETQVLCALIKGLKARNVFEIGTLEGETTVNMAYNLEELGHVYTLDLPQVNNSWFQVGFFIREKGDVSNKITQLFGDSKEFDFLPFHDQIDLMFIDGEHEYEGVLSDSENAVQCVRSGGFIVWHDFGRTHLASSTAILETCEKYSLSLSRIDGTAMVVAQNT
jgi:predicted O-methyltransferase YrrM